jgi:hypothetical protein
MIPPFSVIPSRLRPATFSPDMDQLLSEFPSRIDAMNALEQSLQLVATTGTSTSTLTVATGSVSIATQAGKAWAPGAFLYVSSAASITNVLYGQVVSYNVLTGALVLNVLATRGAGTFSAWVLGLSVPRNGAEVFDGEVTAQSFRVDAGFVSTLAAGINPLIQFDSGDYIMYERGSNGWAFMIGGTQVMRVSADGPARTGNATGSDGLVSKSQMESAILRAMPVGMSMDWNTEAHRCLGWVCMRRCMR